MLQHLNNYVYINKKQNQNEKQSNTGKTNPAKKKNWLRFLLVQCLLLCNDEKKKKVRYYNLNSSLTLWLNSLQTFDGQLSYW